MMRYIRVPILISILLSMSLWDYDSRTEVVQSPKWVLPSILNTLGIEINEDQYGGMYLNDGVYQFNIVGDKVVGDRESRGFKYQFHSVNYSLKYLNEVFTKAVNHTQELEITAVELNEQDNKVYIYIKELDDDHLKRIKKVIDSQAIEVLEHVGLIVAT